MNLSTRSAIAVALTTQTKLHWNLRLILIYCVLTHTDGFTYSAPALSKLMGIPRRTISHQISELVRLKVWTLKEKRPTQNNRELYVYDCHLESIRGLVDGIGQPLPCTKLNVLSNVLTNKESIRQPLPNGIGQPLPNTPPKIQLPPDVQKRIDDFKSAYKMTPSINGWS